jgi:hypothetical protein
VAPVRALVGLRCELHRHNRVRGQPFVQGLEGRDVSDGEGDVVQTDVLLAVEGQGGGACLRLL